MTIQRAVVSGIILDAVQTRTMFTANVNEVGGDTAEVLWSAYLNSIYTPILSVISDNWEGSSYEVQEYNAGQWTPTQVVAFAKVGSQTGPMLPNFVSIVLIGVAEGIRHIGRKFFGPLAETAYFLNGIEPTKLADVALALLAYITPVTGIAYGTLEPGILNKSGVFQPFVGGTISSLLGTMRRRKPGIGM